MYRHGDVLIQPVAEVPEGARQLPHVILAQGELTGHAHRIEPAGAAVLHQTATDLFLRVLQRGAKVVHEEHHAIEIPPGIYRVWRQREYSPAEIRTVRD